ncbi:hypothetical protein J2129_002760 [Methanofollis sp. W23]|uniref:hypothetical protein n=1 Tax=Methanofollis sp. W23 TaxID=2817849 RepID=UPI001AEA7BB7|nr:hypothetical protein [Methanofollis sp. W23]MBP2147247.1 hypothetical protein [Methanofollis sp. W23]
MSSKTVYTEDEVTAAANTAAYRARVATVLTLLAEDYPGGVVGATLTDIMKDYGIIQPPEGEEESDG